MSTNKTTTTSEATAAIVEDEVIDVNLASQAGDETETSYTTPATEAPTTAPTTAPTSAPTSAPKTTNKSALKSVANDTTDAPTSDTISEDFNKSTGLRVDIDKIVSECDTDEKKKAAYDKLLWHVGQIHNVGDKDAPRKLGRYDADGNVSSLVSGLKTKFGQ